MAVKSNLAVNIRAEETGTGGLGTPTEIHELSWALAMLTGTASNKSDLVWSSSGTLTATTLDIDLAGSLTTKVTGAVNFVEVTAIIICNKTTTAGRTLIVGAGSNPIASPWIAAGDGVNIGPGGCLVLTSPVDGYAVAAGTADILRLNSGANTVDYELIIIGRST